MTGLRNPAGGTSRPIRVGMLVGALGDRNGGVPASLHGMSKAVQDLPDVSVTVFACDAPGAPAPRERWAPVELRTFPALGPSTFGFARGLDRALERADMDVLHVHGLWMYISIAARRWAARTRRPYIVSSHGMLDPWAVANSGWKKSIALRAYERGHLDGALCVHALCGSERDAIRSFGLRNPICTIPNGVEPITSTSHPADGVVFPWKRKTLLYLGRLTPKKGLSPLIEAWASVKPSMAAGGWDLAIAGDGPPEFAETLKALAERLGVSQSVRFLGHVSGIAKTETFAAADAFILPSISEGQPLAVLEAWSHGLPALITPQCNLAEGFAAGAAMPIGWSGPELARGLSELFDMSASARREMGACGRALVEERFSWRKSADDWADVYRWAVGGAASPQSVSR